MLSFQIHRCVQLNSVLFVVVVHAGCDKQGSLMRGSLCGKLHRPPSHCSSHRSNSQTFVENRDFCLPNLHSTSSLGGSPSEYCRDVWYGKTSMAWLPGGEKVLKIIFICFDRVHERDRRTDGHRIHITASAALMHIAQQKSRFFEQCLTFSRK